MLKSNKVHIEVLPLLFTVLNKCLSSYFILVILNIGLDRFSLLILPVETWLLNDVVDMVLVWQGFMAGSCLNELELSWFLSKCLFSSLNLWSMPAAGKALFFTDAELVWVFSWSSFFSFGFLLVLYGSTLLTGPWHV
jgi:hypothetical protein